MSPFRSLSIFIIKTSIKFLSLHNQKLGRALSKLFITLISSSFTLARTNGALPTIRVLWQLRRLLRNPELITFSNIQEALNRANVNQDIAAYLIERIGDDFQSCFRFNGVRRPINRLFSLFFTMFIPYGLSTVSLWAIRPLLYWSTRLGLGLISATVGVLWNESLNSISYLRDFAFYIKDSIESHSDFVIPAPTDSDSHIPTSHQSSTHPDPSQMSVRAGSEPSQMPKDESTWLFVTGIVLMTVTVVFAGICIADYFYPEAVSNTPVIGGMFDSIHNIWDTVKSIFISQQGGGAPEPDPIAPGSFEPAEPISRSSSGSSTDSNGTVKQHVWLKDGSLTPLSRPSTPLSDAVPPKNDWQD